MPTDLYIYYRVPEANAGILLEKVGVLQREVWQRHGIAAALKRRPLAHEGMQTWMEIYLATEDGFEAHLDAAVAEHGLGALIEGKRHVEQFVDVAPCA